MPIKELMNWVAGEKRWRVHKDKKAYWYNPATHGLPATKEGSVKEYWEFTSLFLCHAPRTIAEIHYCNEGKTILDEAVDWLGEKLGIK